MIFIQITPQNHPWDDDIQAVIVVFVKTKIVLRGGFCMKMRKSKIFFAGLGLFLTLTFAGCATTPGNGVSKRGVVSIVNVLNRIQRLRRKIL